MSSLPGEMLLDALEPLDRWTLDTVQFTNRRFHQLIVECMSRKCLREIRSARFLAPTTDREGRSWVEPVGGDIQRDVVNTHEEFAGFFSAFLKLLRSSSVAFLRFQRIDFTPAALSTLVLEAPMIANELTFDSGSCAELTPTQFQALVLHFSPTKLYLGSGPYPPRLLAGQLTDDFLRALTKNRVRKALFPKSKPVDGDVFRVTDDAIVDFCVQPDDAAEEQDLNELKRYAELRVSNGRFTKNIFKRLVEASAVSVRTRSLRVCVKPVRFEDELLRDFAQRLSYHRRRDPWEKRIYNFPGEPREEGAAMDLQIRLERHTRSTHYTLIMVRARRPHPWFHSS